MFCRYLHKLHVPITAENILKDVLLISETIFEHSKNVVKVTPVIPLATNNQFIFTKWVRSAQIANCAKRGKAEDYFWLDLDTKKLPVYGGQIYLTSERRLFEEHSENWLFFCVIPSKDVED